MSTRDYVTVVSGMPRSGTSLMMQMLEAGGIAALTDHRRAADQHNPRGYFEYEAVKRIKQDYSWMEGARGKAVKIIYRLLPYLPLGFSYRVVFIERALGEVFASQRDMLHSLGNDAAGQDEERLVAAFKKELEQTRIWLRAQPNIRTMFVRYEGIIADPARWSDDLSRFLDSLDEVAMAAVVDPKLRHHAR